MRGHIQTNKRLFITLVPERQLSGAVWGGGGFAGGTDQLALDCCFIAVCYCVLTLQETGMTQGDTVDVKQTQDTRFQLANV